MSVPDRARGAAAGARRVTRRRLLVAAGGGALALGAGGILLRGGGGADAEPPPVAPDPGGRPDLQHAWDASLRVDEHGNRIAPRHHRLLHLRLDGTPTVAAAAHLENALRAVEASAPAGPGGVLLAVGWSAAWFEAIGRPSPVPAPEPLSDVEAPELDDHVACIHLASDARERLDAAERLLRAGVAAPLRIADRRDGFIGAGLPRRYARRAHGIPAGYPPARSPLFMGFTAGRRRTQPREEDITIPDGPWAGSTTMHVSVLALALATWYRSLDERQRVARMFGPQVSVEQARNPGPGIIPPGDVAGTARRHGLVGHAQAAAQARRNGRPIILRRDFNGLEGGQPLLHFVALQRSIADFVATRRAMDAPRAVAAHPGITPQVNNGINEWISVRRRANYLVPPRTRRSCPGLEGWDA
jgi:hypothetical protein